MYGYSICMSCVNFDLYEIDDQKWECKCNKGRKLKKATKRKQSCLDFEKHKTKLPWWYANIGEYPEIKDFKKIHEDR